VSTEIICLPIHPSMHDDDVSRVVQVIRSASGSAAASLMRAA